MPGCHLRKYGWGQMGRPEEKIAAVFCTDWIHFLWPVLMFSPIYYLPYYVRSHSQPGVHQNLTSFRGGAGSIFRHFRILDSSHSAWEKHPRLHFFCEIVFKPKPPPTPTKFHLNGWNSQIF